MAPFMLSGQHPTTADRLDAGRPRRRPAGGVLAGLLAQRGQIGHPEPERAVTLELHRGLQRAGPLAGSGQRCGRRGEALGRILGDLGHGDSPSWRALWSRVRQNSEPEPDSDPLTAKTRGDRRGAPSPIRDRLFGDLAERSGRTTACPGADALGARVVTRYDDVVAALHQPGRVLLAPDGARPAPAVAGEVRRPGARPRHADRARQPRPRPAPRGGQHLLHAAQAGPVRAVDRGGGARAGRRVRDARPDATSSARSALPLALARSRIVVGLDAARAGLDRLRALLLPGPARTPTTRRPRRRRPTHLLDAARLRARGHGRAAGPTAVTT